MGRTTMMSMATSTPIKHILTVALLLNFCHAKTVKCIGPSPPCPPKRGPEIEVPVSNVRKVDCSKTALKDYDKSFDACLTIKFKNRTELAGLNMDRTDPDLTTPKWMKGELYTKDGKPKAAGDGKETRVTYSKRWSVPKGYFHENFSQNKKLLYNDLLAK